MTTLNRFPLLGLWAEEAARRLGFRKDEAESLGHAYAVLYAIRAQRVTHPTKTAATKAVRKAAKPEHVSFGGDQLEVVYQDGQVRGQVGGDKPQTPASYHANIVKKFPPGYYDRLQTAFRAALKGVPPHLLKGREVYNLYDQWKKACAVGRLVDLDELVHWCQARAHAAIKKT